MKKLPTFPYFFVCYEIIFVLFFIASIVFFVLDIVVLGAICLLCFLIMNGAFVFCIKIRFYSYNENGIIIGKQIISWQNMQVFLTSYAITNFSSMYAYRIEYIDKKGAVKKIKLFASFKTTEVILKQYKNIVKQEITIKNNKCNIIDKKITEHNKFICASVSCTDIGQKSNTNK